MENVCLSGGVGSHFGHITRARTSLKPCFHYPSWRPELMARVNGWPVSITRQHGPCWREMETGHPSTRAVNSGRQLGVVETGLFWGPDYVMRLRPEVQ